MGPVIFQARCIPAFNWPPSDRFWELVDQGSERLLCQMPSATQPPEENGHSAAFLSQSRRYDYDVEGTCI